MILDYIAVSETVCHWSNTTTCHHQLGDLRLALAAQKKHTTRKYNISASVPGVTMEFWRTFCKNEKKKVRPNSIITPGYPSGYVVPGEGRRVDGGRLLCLASGKQFPKQQ